MLFEEEDGTGRSLPTAWTTVAVADPFVALSAGRSLFRIEDLVSLVTLVKKVSASLDECKADSAGDVKSISPDPATQKSL